MNPDSPIFSKQQLETIHNVFNQLNVKGVILSITDLYAYGEGANNAYQCPFCGSKIGFGTPPTYAAFPCGLNVTVKGVGVVTINFPCRLTTPPKTADMDENAIKKHLTSLEERFPR